MGVDAMRRDAPTRGAREQGFTLVEVIVAGVVMMTVLIPSAMLLSSSAKVLTVTQAKIVAADLATGVLEEDRALADSGPWSGSPPAPALPSLCTTPPMGTQTVNGVVFTIGHCGGWCAQATGAGATTWADYAATPVAPPAYGVLVTVSWSGGSHLVTSGQTLTTPIAVVAAAVGQAGGPPNASALCPL